MLKKKKHYKSNLAKIRKHFQKTSNSEAGKWFKPKEPESGGESKSIIRVLPPWGKAAEGFFYYTAAMHYKFQVGGRNRAIGCPESIGKGKCPICAFIAKLRASGDPDYEPLLKGFGTSIVANRVYWMNVIDRAEPDKIKIFGTNMKFVQEILDASDDPDIGDVTNPETGRDIIITRRGRGGRTRYGYRIRTKSTPVVFKRKDLYQLDKDVVEWMDYNTILDILKENYGDEMRAIGFKIHKSEKDSLKKKKKKHHVEEEDENIEDDEMDESIDEDEEDDIDIDDLEDEDEE